MLRWSSGLRLANGCFCTRRSFGTRTRRSRCCCLLVDLFRLVAVTSDRLSLLLEVVCLDLLDVQLDLHLEVVHLDLLEV